MRTFAQTTAAATTVFMVTIGRNYRIDSRVHASIIYQQDGVFGRDTQLTETFSATACESLRSTIHTQSPLYYQFDSGSFGMSIALPKRQLDKQIDSARAVRGCTS
jgi:hypothetical protein